MRKGRQEEGLGPPHFLCVYVSCLRLMSHNTRLRNLTSRNLFFPRSGITSVIRVQVCLLSGEDPLFGWKLSVSHPLLGPLFRSHFCFTRPFLQKACQVATLPPEVLRTTPTRYLRSSPWTCHVISILPLPIVTQELLCSAY